MNTPKTTTALIILDGFGHSETSDSNAIAAAHTPVWDRLCQQYPHTLVSGSGEDVGLPGGQMGNSEVGHMNLGAGRIVYQELTRISKAIEEGSFYQNPALLEAVRGAVRGGKAVHIMGLVSPGGVHSHEDHISAMIELARREGAQRVYLHAFLDGRDTPPRSAEPSLARLDQQLREQKLGRIASLIGRYYAMDRDQRWERVSQAYALITEAQAEHRADSATEGLQQAYAREESDEFVAATRIQGAGESDAALEEGDALIFMNFRADRARQLTRAFVDPSFDGFVRNQQPRLAGMVMLTQYADDIDTLCAYPSERLTNTLGEVIQTQGKTQLRIAETEKYAHVTFFFSGGREAPFEGETRILVASPQVATYDQQPEMSAPEVTEKLVAAIDSRAFDLVVCNYANGDMVGHTGNFDAAVKAVECLDQCVGQITDALLRNGGQCLITADHGNVEQMRDESTGQAHTAHTCEAVPCLYVGERKLSLNEGGILSDIAPTLLELMGLEQPAEMSGHSLLGQEPAR
ncbi:2,3-bisphosphoglycerate-independent phosphoglycerate mutase [Aestuariirhabdus litorea]|uniref:2,3-bisphosphoglycerate-independent phosphoglycerate mutase n=1 Tax=Aestuariirhabdus litorea TaxID=2528527 RepID=A0A3P3VK53_9GAMM|nr:2,3-bisphosphoglycerate-independent phosphoglycerate mutase [Aestuariirhabdus litorea]RRJ83105.1 2,3-bisphosphoglycerate-independent phosphoglycerate mutase [Aestuariirhabdus litorea]RWW93262.1 2,3-bisphosphoglycerate-independent phosphoglycerate mutase [Endozoicomonadaceae bacterium GTF-13]